MYNGKKVELIKVKNTDKKVGGWRVDIVVGGEIVRSTNYGHAARQVQLAEEACREMGLSWDVLRGGGE